MRYKDKGGEAGGAAKRDLGPCDTVGEAAVQVLTRHASEQRVETSGRYTRPT